MVSTKVKQVIVIRKDLGMRRGKEIAQGSHASIAFLTRRLQTNILDMYADDQKLGIKPSYSDRMGCTSHTLFLCEAEREWIENGFAKICCVVNSEQELVSLNEKAKSLGLESHLIEDEGLTEFGGQLTKTALAIGPDYSDRINLVTSELKLY